MRINLIIAALIAFGALIIAPSWIPQAIKLLPWGLCRDPLTYFLTQFLERYVPTSQDPGEVSLNSTSAVTVIINTNDIMASASPATPSSHGTFNLETEFPTSSSREGTIEVIGYRQTFLRGDKTIQSDVECGVCYTFLGSPHKSFEVSTSKQEVFKMYVYVHHHCRPTSRQPRPNEGVAYPKPIDVEKTKAFDKVTIGSFYIPCGPEDKAPGESREEEWKTARATYTVA